jgi:hypothetical protein
MRKNLVSRFVASPSVSRVRIYVMPAYTESFAHPLVRAMASRLPIVAADSGIHRESGKWVHSNPSRHDGEQA